jgi:hypothetical protein
MFGFFIVVFNRNGRKGWRHGRDVFGAAAVLPL